MDLPSAPTFLFTDIAGSTRLWEEDPEAMAVRVALHDELLHAVVEENGGAVFKGLGDGISAVFDSAANGLAAACAGQRTLQGQDWGSGGPLGVRMALHTGPVQERGGDFFGTTVNRVARLLVTAHPGQVVMTEATAAKMSDARPGGSSILDLGVHRLRDLSRPERVFQLDYPDLPSAFPPLRSMDAHLGNLPYRLTEFIGRDEEIPAVLDLVAGHRLVTLSGTGGIGKTSLALRVAAEVVDEFEQGVWLVELAPLTDEVQIPGVIAGLFGIDVSPGQDVTELLIRELTGKKLLLILDNCEHLVDGVAKLTDALLGMTERVRVLATSREPLRIGGEALYRVPPLDVPEEAASLDQLLEATAVALFADRAGLARSDFVLNGDAPAVAEICRHLDGIPLAIELAAARLDTMTVSQLADRLDDRFRVLARGSRVALPRQQTLEALVDWSYDLLTAPEQALLRRLGVFGGSFTLEAAAQVCSFDPLDRVEVVDLLDRLVETSLVMPPDLDSGRYRMLETIRAYARQRLDSGNETEPTMRRLADYLIGAGPPTYQGMSAGDYVEWWQWRADELENFRSGLNWALTTQQGTICGELAVELANYLWSASLGDEAATWVKASLELLVDELTPLRLRLLSLLAAFEVEFGDHIHAKTLVREVRADAEKLDDESTAAYMLVLEAEVELYEGALQTALALNAEAAERLRAVSDIRFLNTISVGVEILCALGRYDDAEALITQLDAYLPGSQIEGFEDSQKAVLRGLVASHRGDHVQAIELFGQGLNTAVPYGDLEHAAMLGATAYAEFGRGNYTEALPLIKKARSLFPESIANGLAWLEAIAAIIETAHRRLPTAAHFLRNALEAAARRNGTLDRDLVLTAAGEIALAVGRTTDAVVLLAAAVAARERVRGLVPHHWVRQHQERALDQLRESLDPGIFERLWEKGKGLTYEQAARRAIALVDDLTEEA